MNRTLTLSLIFCAFGLGGCPTPNHSHDSPDKVTYILGDPGQFYKGATLNAKSPFTIQELGKLHSYSLVKVDEIQEATQEASDYKSLVKKQTTATGRFAEKSSPTELKMVTNGEWQLQDTDRKIDFNILADQNGQLDIPFVRIGKVEYPSRPVHWSVTENKSMFSVLVSLNDGVVGKRSLYAFYFVKAGASFSSARTDSNSFEYLFGTGKLVGWDARNPLVISVCGSLRHQDRITAAVQAWRETLKGRLEIELHTLGNYPPFSDLNTRCIYSVDAFVMVPEQFDAVVPAATNVVAVAGAQLIDADILFFEREIQKISAYQGESFLDRTTPHEIGHLLGLGHELNGATSIMAYGQSSTAIADRDIEAIQMLYPLQ